MKCRLWFLTTVVGFALGACAQTVKLPAPGPLPAELTAETRSLAPKLADDLVAPDPLSGNFRAVLPEPGQKTLHEVVMTPGLYAALRAVSAGNADEALEILEKEARAATGSLYRWYLSLYRAHTLNLAGRAPEGEEEARQTAKLEIALRGTDLVARTLRGDAKTRLGDFEGAESDYLTVIRALGGWQFPTSYSGFPTNMRDLAITTEAKMRATLGLAFTNTMAGHYADALPWAADLERQIRDLIYVKNHPLYGRALGALHPDVYLARAVNLTFVGAAKIALGEPVDAAEPFFVAARSNYDAIGFRQGDAYVETLKAKALLDAGKHEAALSQADKALALARQRGLFDFIWRIQALAAETLYRAGDFEQAESRFREAQTSVDAITGLLGSDRNKRRFGVGKADITHRLSGLAFRRDDPAAVFEYMERGRARAFIDMLAGVEVAGSAGAPEVAAIRAIDAEAQRAALGQELGKGSPVRSLALDPRSLEQRLQRRRQQVQGLRRRHPALAETLSVSSARLSDARQRLAPGEVLAYWLPTRQRENLRSLIATRDSVALRTLAIDKGKLSDLLENFLDAVATRNADDQIDVASEILRALGVREWGATEAAYVVPSGDIHFIPWGALGIDFPVSVLPTGSWLTRTTTTVRSSNTAVVIGDPDFKGQAPQLPGARREAKTIADLYGTQAITGENATEAAVRRSVGSGVDVLHLATHGIFDARAPLRSAVLLANRQGVGELTAARLFERPLPARLVVLSACETGVGQVSAADDYLGLPRAFYLGGAVSVVSSLWPVDDEGTSLFMRTFHAQARNGDYGKAWLAARDAVKAAGMPAWIYGAFILGGGQRG